MQHNCSHDELIDIHKLVPHPQNPNKHPDNQIERLAKIIDYQGQRSPVVVCKETGFIVVGHGRLEAMKKLGWDKVAVNYQTFKDEAQRYAHMTADNAIAEWAALDLAQINADMLDLGPELDLELLGIEDFVLEPIEKLDPGLVDEDDVPEVSEPITKRGDVWLLGDHRVMCGDSTMIDDVEKLMNGEKADMVFTDPPYGINEQCDRAFSSRTRLAKGNTFEQIKNDDSIDCAISAFNLVQGLNIPRQIWWGANYYSHHVPQTNNWIVWDKRVDDNQSNANSDCELAYVKSKWSSVRIFRHLWKGMIKQSEHNQKRVHPTQKPIALAEWCFNYYKSDFKNVLDLFLGSGSTLIACQKTNRKCFGMELDEHYCDVIVNRWQNYTGKKAVLESNSKTYDELKDSNV